jgi:phthalate 4,5-dioxygenase
MLSVQDNMYLCQTGPGTEMGDLFRRFWLPLLLPSELPGPDSPPIRVRVLGEDLVAFRDTNGRVGFFQENCPHRGASLFFGRNEEAGLRCVYHGWKFDVDGNCIDMPSEPAESNFKSKVHVASYPSAEWGGLVWVYMGPQDKRPPLPLYDWCLRHQEGKIEPEVHTWKWVQDCNWVQALEGNIDTAHITYLHRRGYTPTIGSQYGISPDQAADVQVLPEKFGFTYGGRRTTDDGKYYWRVTPYMFPTFTSIPSPRFNGSGHFLIPRDDTTSWWLVVQPNYKPNANVPPFVELIPGTWTQTRNRGNDYLIDRGLQKNLNLQDGTGNYTGLASNRVEDSAIIESMGYLYDRSREHLGTVDAAIIYMRRMIIRVARDLAQGVEPEILRHPEWFAARPVDIVNSEPKLEPVWTADRAEYEYSGERVPVPMPQVGS